MNENKTIQPAKPGDLPPDLAGLVAAAADGEVKLNLLVRDPQGRPKFDDPHNVPQEILDMLNESDLEYLDTLKQAC